MSPRCVGADALGPPGEVRSTFRGYKARRSYNLRFLRLRQAGSEAADHVMVDAAGRKPDGVGNRGRGRVSVRDHDEAAQAQEVGAAVRVGVEALAEAAPGWTDEEPPEGSDRARGDLRAQRVEERPDRALDGLERDVAGEPVGHEDVGCALEDVAPLGVAAEVEVRGGEQLVGLER